MTSSLHLLEVQQLRVRFGGLVAVNNMDLQVRPGEIVSIIGPNGAGKTTVFNVITGVYAPTAGRVLVEDTELIRPFGGHTVAGFVTLALLAAASLTVAVNVEPLWQAVITAHYEYQKAFPWGHALASVGTFFAEHTGRRLLLPALIGGAIGLFGAWTVWHRARRAPEVAARRGLARTFQTIRLFRQMTVLDNVLIGLDRRRHSQIWDIALRLPRYRREHREALAEAAELLKFAGLDAEANQLADHLSYGHQHRLEIARALATKPRLLLLDEPAAGLNPSETEDLMHLIRRIRDQGVTILLIEHDMRVVAGISDRVIVLDHGEKIAEGTPAEVWSNPQVVEAYLGKRHVCHSERSEESPPATTETLRCAQGDSGESMNAPLLQLKNVHAGYGPIEVLKGVDLAVNDGEIVTVLGANGAGKSTLLMTICGVLPCRRGTVTFAGAAVQNLPAEEIVRRGLSQVPEGRLIFPRLTVRENLEMGAFQNKDGADLDRAYALFPILKERQNQPGGTLSGGEQQMLAIARALMVQPKMLLLDEPSLGLAPILVAKIFDIIREINRVGTTILLVEQNANMALHVAHRGYVLQTGQIVLADTAANLMSNEQVKRSYLGG